MDMDTSSKQTLSGRQNAATRVTFMICMRLNRVFQQNDIRFYIARASRFVYLQCDFIRSKDGRFSYRKRKSRAYDTIN